MTRKMKSPALVSLGLVEAGLIKTVLRDSASGAMASVTPLHTAPSTTGVAAAAMILLNADNPSATRHRSSSTSSCSFRPPMPPVALISSTASPAASRGGVPQCAASPDKGSTAPMVMTSLSAAAGLGNMTPQMLIAKAVLRTAATVGRSNTQRARPMELRDPKRAGCRPRPLARDMRGGRDKRNLGDQLLDDGAAERAEVLGYQNEGARSADHIVLIVFFETAGRICVLGIPGYRPIAENDETIDDNSLGERLVAGELHVAAGI